ncbi:DUF1073 domain-containing protein [Pseudomonas sp. 10C3]|uniref:DUF1073 domain-containing protein n=1 Tax=Pseudomonas sp. 10C3 TaxID=3118753 RepID=UPI002E803F62|nr:DUF1073 domain-containing protein [Pseudomonas sp. 10C3]MEE3504845.1 DUF1073 domain-containing protein [Pseudomonas sp. 10C3]
MSKRHTINARAAKIAQQTDAARRVSTGDSFQNFAARVGLGTDNQSANSSYGFSFVSRNRIQMEATYRSSWIAGRAVDVGASDMTREGIEFNSIMPPDEKDKMSRAFERLQIWKSLCDNEKWSRLYGGSIAVMLIDGQKPETPLRLDSIGKGQFKGLLVLDRWLVQPSLENLVTEYGPDMGKPKFYTVIADAQALVNQKIHHTRVIRRGGVELPYWQRISENGWGQSVLERLWDRLIAFDSVTQGTAQLVYKAHLRTYKVEKLRELIATGGRAFEALLKQIDMIRQFQSNEGMTLMDSTDEFETHQYAFGGLSDVMLRFGEQVAGALETPSVILFGQSPGGLSSSSDSEIRIYYDNVKAKQDSDLRPGVTTLCDVISRSELGKPLPEGFAFDFAPLWQLSDTEKADIAGKDTTTVLDAFEAGLISRQTALKELRQSSNTTGMWSNITDEEIDKAEDEPPPPPDLEPEAPDNANPDGGQAKETKPGQNAPS